MMEDLWECLGSKAKKQPQTGSTVLFSAKRR